MTTQEKLDLYLGMLRCSYPLELWIYDADMKMRSTTVTGEFAAYDFLEMCGYSELIQQYLKESGENPVLLSNHFGVMFYCVIERTGNKSEKIYAVGPVLEGHDSISEMEKKFNAHDLTVSTRLSVLRTFAKAAVIPSSSLLLFIRMLHYCVTGKTIDNTCIQYLFTAPPAAQTDAAQNDGPKAEEPAALHFRAHAGIKEAEERFLYMVRDGNPDYREALTSLSSLSNGVKTDSPDPLRQAKNNLLVLLTLICRASMQGGLSPETAYSLNDHYAGRIEDSTGTGNLSRLANELTEDYVQRVRTAKLENGISVPIRNACDFIHQHVTEEIHISDLARENGYTKYYFSQKFQKETGMTVAAYTRKAKIEEARRLLQNTNQSITEIADSLSFGSRSSFFTAFRSVCGCSPKEFRDHSFL